MNESVPSVTVLIPARPGQAEVRAVGASRVLDYPPEKLEIIVARGQQPSAQRNAALKAAQGELVYFLDDDSLPESGNLRVATAHFLRPEVQMVGGPNLCPAQAPWLEQVFAVVLSSWLAFGPSRARYMVLGEPRETSEKELILCNLMARRQAILDLGGFNEALYPNEENALMDELQKRRGKMLYDPRFIVHRRPRSSLKAFAKMVMTYGRGRAEQLRLHPTFGSALNFVPPLFLLYLAALAAALVLAPSLGRPMLGLLALYGVVVLAQIGILVVRHPALRAMAAFPFIVLTNILYGWGFWRGLFTPLTSGSQRPSTPVDLERIHPESRKSILP